MKESAVLYWIYAIIKSSFGLKADIYRSSLRAHYKVNKYDIDVFPTDGLTVVNLMNGVHDVLIKSGYRLVERGCYLRHQDGKSIFIYVELTGRGNQQGISIHPAIYPVIVGVNTQ